MPPGISRRARRGDDASGGSGSTARDRIRAGAGAVLILLAAIAAAYANALEASFQFDDWEVIVRDPRVQGLAAWWDAMPGMRPLLKLSYALNHASGLGVVGFHAVNVGIHAINALLVMTLADRLVQRSAPGVEGSSGGAIPGFVARPGFPLAAALLFALHPLQTEAVTYASGRSTALSTGFALASLLLGIAATDADVDAGRRRSWLLGASLGAMGLGLAVKESAVAVPAALMLWRATDPSRPAGFRDLLRISALHWLALFVALAAALALPAYRHLVATSLATRTPGENLVAQIHAVLYLLGQIVRIDRLNADPALPAITQLDPKGLLGAVVLVAIPVLAVAKRRRAPIAAFAILWTTLWLLPTNSLLARLDLVNDRQAYGALVGPALLVALGLRALAARSRSGLVLAGLALVGLCVGLGVATHRRNAVYRDEVVFWKAVIEASPGNARAFNNLGIALAARCDEAGAIRAWRQALALDPAFVRAAVNLRLAIEGAAPSSEADCPETPISR
jgi:hypothetical protein